MTILSVTQAAQYASNYGFTGASLRIAVSIAQAESNLNTAITSPRNWDGSVDRGLYQINSKAWASIADAICYDPAGASRAAFTISKQGTDFTPWSTFNSGAYQHTNAWSQLGTAGAVSAGAASLGWSASKSLATWPWLTLDGSHVNLNNPYHSSFEPSHGLGIQYGVGVPTPFHTVITSLSSGLVLDAFFKDYGGVILVRTSVAGKGQETLSYLHMDDIYVKAGDTVKVGQPLGLSGGQVTGGDHPAGQYSTGPHIDLAFNNPNFGKTLGPNFDPTPWLGNLIRNGPSLADLLAMSSNPIVSTVGTGIGGAQTLSDTVVSGSGPLADNFATIFKAMDNAMALRPLIINQQRVQNPVANVPVIGGVVGALETPVAAVGNGVGLATGLVDWVGNNTGPVLFRGITMGLGLILVLAFFAAMIGAGAKATSADDAIKTVAKSAAVGAVAA